MFLDIAVLRWGWGTRSRQINTSQLKYPIRGNGKIVSNLAQNFDTLCLMICSIVRMFFEKFQHNSAGYVDRSISQFSQKISFSGKTTIRAQFGPKVFNLISHDLSQRFVLKLFSMMGHNRQTKITQVSFSRNPVLVQLDDLSHILAKIKQPSIASNYIL